MLTVFGSINTDIAVRVHHFPAAGETVLGGDALISPGGKGANQAHAARLFGVNVTMAGAVGRDSFAEIALAQLRRSGVDTSAVASVDGHATGIATITVSDGGENAIVVAPGANWLAQDTQVSNELLSSTSVLLLQMEVPFAASQRLARRARDLGCKVVFNASPMAEPAKLDFAAFDIIVVNRIELAQICAARSVGSADPIEQARDIADQLRVDVLVTLGSAGAFICCVGGEEFRFKAEPVAVVDTTGAGDTFAGIFGAALALGSDVAAAMRFAVVGSGLACTRVGAQNAQPTRQEILDRISDQDAG